MKCLLWRYYKIKDLSFLDKIADEPTFSHTEDDEEEGDEEEVNQQEPPRYSFLALSLETWR